MKMLMVLVLCSVALAEEKKPVRVYLTDHESWQQASTLVAGTYTGATKTEQIKTLTKACPVVTVTEDAMKADFILRWDSKTWQQTSWGGHENEFTLYNTEKDVLGTGSAHHMKNAAKDICKLIASKVPSQQSASR
jgi:predicted P-loop ATPase